MVLLMILSRYHRDGKKRREMASNSKNEMPASW
jgi:hypothetical protein